MRMLFFFLSMPFFCSYTQQSIYEAKKYPYPNTHTLTRSLSISLCINFFLLRSDYFYGHLRRETNKTVETKTTSKKHRVREKKRRSKKIEHRKPPAGHHNKNRTFTIMIGKHMLSFTSHVFCAVASSSSSFSRK